MAKDKDKKASSKKTTTSKSSSKKTSTQSVIKTTAKSINKLFPDAKSEKYNGPTFEPEEYTGTYTPTEFTDEYIPSSYNSKYLPQIEAAMDRINNWSYDPLQDASYQALAKVYGARGNLAAKNSLADAAALNGGYGSSYAVSAAQQARNQYNQELASLVPQLEQASYERQQNTLNALMDLDNALYTRFADDENRRLQGKQFGLDVAGFNEGNKQFAANFGLDAYDVNNKYKLSAAQLGLDTWNANRGDYWTGKNYKANNLTTALSTGLNYLGYKDDHALFKEQMSKLKGKGGSSGGGGGGGGYSGGGYTGGGYGDDDAYKKAQEEAKRRELEERKRIAASKLKEGTATGTFVNKRNTK